MKCGICSRKTGASNSETLRKVFWSFILVCITIYAHGQNSCKLKKDQDSIKVYTCHTDSSKFKSIIAEFTINTTFEELTKIVLDVPGYTNWQYNTVGAQVIKTISESEKIYRTAIEAPWPVTNRDMVVVIKIHRDQYDHEMTIATESKTGVVPVMEGFIRVPSSRGFWMVKQISKNRLQVKYTMQIDPGGSVPVWLVNWVCAQAPYQSFKNLKRILEKKLN
jgi:hypothetical protein